MGHFVSHRVRVQRNINPLMTKVVAYYVTFAFCLLLFDFKLSFFFSGYGVKKKEVPFDRGGAEDSVF